MARTHLDRKNVALALLIYRLRQAIDVYRIIGLNTRAAKKLGGHVVSGKFFGFVQMLCLDAIAITICKIFEFENPKKRYRLNSISGVMTRLAKHKYTAAQAKAIERFGRAYGNVTPCNAPTDHLLATIAGVRAKHRASLIELREFRNQYAAHSQFGAKQKSLPSIDEFEALFQFAADFYKLVSGGILDIGPASFPLDAGSGLVRTLENLGLKPAQFDFPAKPAP